MFLFSAFLIPRALSSSNHYVDKLGGYHEVWICTLSPPNASPELKRIQFCPSVSAPRAQSLPLIEQSELILCVTMENIYVITI